MENFRALLDEGSIGTMLNVGNNTRNTLHVVWEHSDWPETD